MKHAKFEDKLTHPQNFKCHTEALKFLCCTTNDATNNREHMTLSYQNSCGVERTELKLIPRQILAQSRLQL